MRAKRPFDSSPDREEQRVTLMDMILRSDYQATPLHSTIIIIPAADKYGDYDPNTRIPQPNVLYCLHRPRSSSGFLVRWGRERGRPSEVRGQ